MNTISRWCPSLIAGLLAMLAAACSTTAVVSSHPALAKSGETGIAKVYFLRPDVGYRGVEHKPFSIALDDQGLLTLAAGEYVLVYLRPVSATVTVESYTVVRQARENDIIKVTESVPFSFEAGKTYYLSFAGRPLGWKSGGGISYLPVLMSHRKAIATASRLKPVGNAAQEPIAQKGS